MLGRARYRNRPKLIDAALDGSDASHTDQAVDRVHGKTMLDQVRPACQAMLCLAELPEDPLGLSSRQHAPTW